MGVDAHDTDRGEGMVGKAARGGDMCVGGAVVAEEPVEVLAAAAFGGVCLGAEKAPVEWEGCHWGGGEREN